MTLKGELLHFFKLLPGYEKYTDRIKKTLYYGKMPSTDRPSFPMTGLLVEKFNSFCTKKRLDRLDLHAASSICYDSCVTPCSVIIALLYLDRLRRTNPEYLEVASPSHIFIVSMMVASKYLYDDGEEDEVYNDEWAASSAMLTIELNEAERNFLAAIDWNLYVDLRTFLNALVYVEVEVAKNQAINRGYFTYTDLNTISQVMPSLWTSLIHLLSSALAVCFVGYAATIFSVSMGPLVAIKCNSYMGSELFSSLKQPLEASKSVFDLNSTDSALTTQDLKSESDDVLFNDSYIHAMSEDETLLDGSHYEDGFKLHTPVFSARFSTLRTLTTALLLASSTSGQYSRPASLELHSNFLSGCHPYLYPPFKSVESSTDTFLGTCWPPDQVPEGLTFWNSNLGQDLGCSSCSNQWLNVLNSKDKTSLPPFSEYKFPNIEPDRTSILSFQRNLQNSVDKPPDLSKEKYTDSLDNLTEIIFRSEFASFTTGAYNLPSSISNGLHSSTTERPDMAIEKVDFSHCPNCSNDRSPSLLSKLLHIKWIQKFVTFLHWKSLPPDAYFSPIHFEAMLDASLPTLLT